MPAAHSTSVQYWKAIGSTRASPATPLTPVPFCTVAAAMLAQGVPWSPVGPPPGRMLPRLTPRPLKRRSGWPRSQPSSMTAMTVPGSPVVRSQAAGAPIRCTPHWRA